MEFSINCPDCGKQMAVSASQAGADVPCLCGRSVAVPRLSELRQSVGRGAFEAGTIDRIQTMIRQGELPESGQCAECGRMTEEAIELYVECERSWSKAAARPSGCGAILLTILLLPLGILRLALFSWMVGDPEEEDPDEVIGYDRVVRVPLHVCPHHRGETLPGANQATLKRLLRTVPIYAKLLDEYPEAEVTAK